MSDSDLSTNGEGAAPPPPAPMQAGAPILRATVTITRAATGKVETYELIGTQAEEKEY